MSATSLCAEVRAIELVLGQAELVAGLEEE